MDADEYIKQRLDDQISWYDRKSLANQRWFKRLRMAEFVAAACIPFLAAYLAPELPATKVVIGLLGVGIAVITATLDPMKSRRGLRGGKGLENMAADVKLLQNKLRRRSQ